MDITTAVIPVAGAGSRMFPGTTTIEKCMMPVYAGARAVPLVDYMVADCIGAGVTRIIFVTTERGERQLRDYFDIELNSTLIAQLNRVGKTDAIAAETERRRALGITIEYLVQDPNEYGTAVPLATAKAVLQTEAAFAVMGGDDFVYHPDGTSELGLAIEAWKRSGSEHGVMGLPIPRGDAGRYGILQTGPGGFLTAIDEKPPEDRWPEQPVANISRYILRSSIWPYVDAEMARSRGTAEHYITYPINDALAAGQTFYVHPVTGTYLDGGNAPGIVKASQYITEHPPLV